MRPVSSARAAPRSHTSIHLADLIANALKRGRSGERMVPPRWIGMWDALSLDPATLPDLMTSMQSEFADMVGVFALGAEDS